jgi:hypothetical protein
MAKLCSEDEETRSFLELRSGGVQVSYKLEVWQPIALYLVSGSRTLSVGSDESVQESLLCRKPRDEVRILADSLKEVLEAKSKRALFEPAEPFFELMVERSERHGLKVEVWLDAGSAESGIYTWDASGIRLHTNEDKLAQFIRELESEFAC